MLSKGQVSVMLFWNPGSYHGESIGRNHITLRMIDDGGDSASPCAIGVKEETDRPLSEIIREAVDEYLAK